MGSQVVHCFPLAHPQIGGEQPKLVAPQLCGMWSQMADGSIRDASDDGLHLFEAPALGSSLVQGFEDWPGEAVGGGGAADSTRIDKNAPPAALATAHIITFRHNLILLARCPYETRRPMAMDVHRTATHLRLEVAAKPDGGGGEQQQRTRPGYMGRRFERLCRGGAEDSWCGVVLTGYDEMRVLVGAEIDCCTVKGPAGALPPLEHLLELKTHRQPTRPEEEEELRRHKLLDAYLQAFLVGVTQVGLGMRDDEAGTLVGLERLPTRGLSRHGGGEPAFDAWICFRFLRNVLRVLLNKCLPGRRYRLELARPFAQVVLRDVGALAEDGDGDGGSSSNKKQKV